MNLLGWARNEIEERRLWVLIAVLIAALLFTTYAYNVATKVENTFVEPVAERVGIRSPASEYQCPDDWTTTRGYEPESQLNFVTCTDGRYIITKRDGVEPVGFDGERGIFVDVIRLDTVR